MNAQASIDVIDERVRQLEEEDWDYTHDDEHINGELIHAAICYAQIGQNPYDPQGQVRPMTWPWGDDDWKPKSNRENLVRAAALLIAEIERLDRATHE